ncbi:MAG: SDR family oxidoreductase [Acidobacteriota bacterium]|nr:SDR family oxidoreductase [Acidobacteriota bacterium]
MDLSGKTALVTGAARRVGKAVALGLARRGADVVIHYNGSQEAAERTAAEIAGLGVEAVPLGADLRHAREIERLFLEIGERIGRLDVLVNSAASFRAARFEEISSEAWDEVMALNVRAPFLCSRLAASLMRRPSGKEDTGPDTGAIVNISDLSAYRPWPGYTHHGASKAALVHLTSSSALELAPDIRVNCVIPGAILPPPGVDLESEEWRRRGESVLLGRTGNGKHVADAVVSLIENDFITGAILPVDGGERLLK